ncbi:MULTISPECIES: MoxR family ATPase [unclassified Psychrobacter]|uniref:AAA family ATPase n=1 Tax=unclassified Psychrobacter TaxID=196806 RepID=UPI0025B48FBA|nr:MULTISPECIES: MoxR family ATPase [unclassified Psychrobacter]MDN3453146.1 MoxR family ATPase [Psychrobacter sp. APC 3350]MDN3501629.1 MoxR family ATPase [Psychrobacter sp. 5A.1]
MTHAANDTSLSSPQPIAATLSPSTPDIKHNQQKIAQLIEQLNQIVLDKPQVVKLALSGILAGGHLLLQDLPGMGKTTLAQGLAQLLGLSFSRVQFTNDMLPADILGMSIYDQNKQQFEFRAGPIFTQLLLADEINRSSPKTQSALLEAMEERQVTQDGQTYPLPQPFFVIATQNPLQQAGVYPLPESQLDRFLLCLSLGYPSPAAERELLKGEDRRELLKDLDTVLDTEAVLLAQQGVRQVYVADVVLDYLQRLVAKTRASQEYHGLSPRGVLSLQRAAQAHAYVSGYMEVTPEDIQAVFAAVTDHRLGQRFVPAHVTGGQAMKTIAQRILAEVSVIA